MQRSVHLDTGDTSYVYVNAYATASEYVYVYVYAYECIGLRVCVYVVSKAVVVDYSTLRAPI